jgi:hypothetical protein
VDRRIRSLIAWVDQNEAVTTLLGHLPGPAEDTSGQKQVWEVARRALEGRAAFRLPTPNLTELPPELLQRGNAFRLRPDVIATFPGLDWTVGIVDLKDVLSFQKIVIEEEATERANAVIADDLQSLFSFCLPDPAEGIGLSGTMDPDQKGITLSSLNPNLRIGGHIVADVDVVVAPGSPAQKQKFVGYSINFGARFVQVAEYNSRWFVRDGYHRTFGLTRRGINRIPCVFIRARSFAELGAAAPGFFSYEVLFGDRPPFLTDFLDDAVSTSANQKAHRKVVRISAEEFQVEV